MRRLPPVCGKIRLSGYQGGVADDKFKKVVKGLSGEGALETLEGYSLALTPFGGIYREFCWTKWNPLLISIGELSPEAWPKSRKDETRPDGDQEYFETLDGSEFSSLQEACSFAIRFWHRTDTLVI